MYDITYEGVYAHVNEALCDHDIKEIIRIFGLHDDYYYRGKAIQEEGEVEQAALKAFDDGIMNFIFQQLVPDSNKLQCKKPFVPYSPNEQHQLLVVVNGLIKKTDSCIKYPYATASYCESMYRYKSMFIQHALFNNQRYNDMVDEFTGRKFNSIDGELQVTVFSSFNIPERLVNDYNVFDFITKQIEALKKIGRNDDANIYGQVVCIHYWPEDDRYCNMLEANSNKLKSHLAFKEKILGPIKKWETTNKCEDLYSNKRYTEASKCYKDSSILYGNAIKALPKLGLNDYQSYLVYKQKGFNLYAKHTENLVEQSVREPIKRAQRLKELEAEEEEDRQVGRVVGEAIGRMLLQYAK